LRWFLSLIWSFIYVIDKFLDVPDCPDDIICPECGYYCLGKGGAYCIDKPSLVKDSNREGCDDK
jgi:hypothetical protein